MLVASAMPTWARKGRERERAGHVHDHADTGKPHGCHRVLAREIGGREHLVEHEGGQADGEGHQRPRGGGGRLRPEGAALEEHRHDGARHDQQRRRGRKRKGKGKLQRPVEPVVGVMRRGVAARAQGP